MIVIGLCSFLMMNVKALLFLMGSEVREIGSGIVYFLQIEEVAIMSWPIRRVTKSKIPFIEVIIAKE